MDVEKCTRDLKLPLKKVKKTIDKLKKKGLLKMRAGKASVQLRFEATRILLSRLF